MPPPPLRHHRLYLCLGGLLIYTGINCGDLRCCCTTARDNPPLQHTCSQRPHCWYRSQSLLNAMQPTSTPPRINTAAPPARLVGGRRGLRRDVQLLGGRLLARRAASFRRPLQTWEYAPSSRCGAGLCVALRGDLADRRQLVPRRPLVCCRAAVRAAEASWQKVRTRASVLTLGPARPPGELGGPRRGRRRSCPRPRFVLSPRGRKAGGSGATAAAPFGWPCSRRLGRWPLLGCCLCLGGRRLLKDGLLWRHC